MKNKKLLSVRKKIKENILISIKYILISIFVIVGTIFVIGSVYNSITFLLNHYDITLKIFLGFLILMNIIWIFDDRSYIDTLKFILSVPSFLFFLLGAGLFLTDIVEKSNNNYQDWEAKNSITYMIYSYDSERGNAFEYQYSRLNFDNITKKLNDLCKFRTDNIHIYGYRTSIIEAYDHQKNLLERREC